MKNNLLKYEINYNELEFCMIKLFGDYDIFNHENIKYQGSRAIYLTTGGKCVAYKFIDKSEGGLNHCQMNMITIRCYMDGKSEDEKNFIKKQFPWIPYNNFLEWDDMYGKNMSDNIQDYMKLKPSVEVNDDFPCGVPEGGVYSPTQINTKILKESKIARVNKRWDQYGDELNIESYHPLTYLQRRFLLDVIKFYKVDIDHIYIDDFSKENGVIASQLGIRK